MINKKSFSYNFFLDLNDLLSFFFPDQLGGAKLHLLHWTEELQEAAEIFTCVLPRHTEG